MMDKINPGKISVSPSTLLDKIAIVLTLVGTVIGLIQLMCATNPATIVVSAILVVLDFVLSIFTLVNNIKTIQQLEQQKAELEERFKKGGKFDRQVTSMADLSFQMMENFYMFTVNFKSLMNQLAANINFISLSDPDNSTGLNYQ